MYLLLKTLKRFFRIYDVQIPLILVILGGRGVMIYKVGAFFEIAGTSAYLIWSEESPSEESGI